MRTASIVSLPLAFLVVASCSSSTASAPPAAAPAPAAAVAGRGGAPGGGRGRGGPPSTPEQRATRRDSIAGLRAATVKDLMATIAGKENEPASAVFKNVQLMKSVPAGEFLAAMDQGISKGTGHNCTDCHVSGDWASDSLPRKKTARLMMELVAGVNSQFLSKMPPGRGGQPRTIQCMTCHRGGNNAGNTAIIP